MSDRSATGITTATTNDTPRRRHRKSSEAEPAGDGPLILRPGHSGEWMDAAQMRRWAIEHLESSAVTREVVLDLSGLEHLDATALQVLLAFRAELLRRQGALRLANASESLRHWFYFAGAGDLLAAGNPG